MQGVGGHDVWSAGYRAAGGTADAAAASPATGSSGESGPGGFPALLNGEQVTGGVTATLPNGITIGVWSLAPIGSAPSDASSGDTTAASGGSAPAGGPDFSAMEKALEQMVDDFMGSQGFGATTSTAAQQAYGAAPGERDPASKATGASAVA